MFAHLEKEDFALGQIGNSSQPDRTARMAAAVSVTPLGASLRRMLFLLPFHEHDNCLARLEAAYRQSLR